jgi:hypothetical protein
MASFKKNAEVTVTLNGEAANAMLKQMAERAKAVGDQIREIAKKGAEATDDERKQLALLQKEHKSLEAAQKSVTKSTYDYAQVLKNLNGSTLRELEKAKKALRAQLQHLVPDTQKYIDKTKELQQVDARVRQLNAGMREQRTVWQNITAAAGKFFPVAALATGAISIIKQLGSAFSNTFTSIQATGDEWAATLAGINAGWDYFKRSLVTADWSNFFSNINAAITAGREYAQILDDLGERRRSYRIIESETRQEVAQLEIQLKNVNLTNEERIAIADKIIAKEDALLKHRKSMAKTEFDGITNLVAANTTLDQVQLKRFMREYEQNKELISQAGEYIENLKEYKRYSEGAAANYGGTEQPEAKRLKKEIDSASEAVQIYAAIKQKYDKSTDKELDKMVEAWVNLNNVTTDYYTNIQTAEVRKNRLLGKDNNVQQKTNEEAYKTEIAAAEARNRELRKVELKQYEQKEIDEKTFNAKVEALEDNLIVNKIAINKKYNKDTGTLEDQLLARRTKRVNELAKMDEQEREKNYKAELDTTEDFYRAERKKQADRYTRGLIDKEQYDDSIKSLDQLLLQEKLALNIQYGKDTTAIEDQIVAYQIKCYEDVQRLLAEEDEKAAREKLEREKQLRAEADAIITELRSQSIRETMNFELEQLEELHKVGLLSEKQYEQKKLQTKLKAAQQYAQKAAQLADIGANLVGAVQDAEYAKLEAQKEKELALAGDNAEKRQQIEEEYEAKKLEVQKKYADLDMAAKIAQTIAAGALAVIQAFAQLGPIGGAISAALIGVTTAFQIASIVQQRNAIKSMSPGGSGGSSSAPTSQRVVLPGREEGGYIDAEREQDGRLFRARRRKRRGYVDAPTVLTGEAGPEFVANAGAVANPTIRPVLDMIDIAQRNGSIGSLNLPKLIRAAGYAQGGYTADRPLPAATDTPTADRSLPTATADKALLALLAETRNLLRELKTNGVKAPVVLSELEKKQALLTKSRNLGSRNS